MQGVTTAIVLFLFLCLAIPSIIKHKNQYYVALIAVVAIILIDAVAHMVPSDIRAFQAVCYVLCGFGQLIALVALVLATGGFSARELGGDMIEVLRRGETQKEVIIPLSDEAKRKIQASQEEAERRIKRDEDEPKVYTIDDPAPVPPPAGTPPAPKTVNSTGPLPLS